MATKKKLLQAAAGSATGGAGLDIDEVFSTYLYEGTGSAQTITNGIDLDGEGGLVWIKERPNATSHQLFNTEVGLSGTGSRLSTNDTGAFSNSTRYISSFNSNGFSIGDENDVNRGTGAGYASWTFRKAPKFFDVVTYTGDNTGDRVLSHNVGTVGAVFVKNLTSGDNYSGNWCVHHRSLGTSQSAYLNLNQTSASGQGTGINPVFSSTDTTVTIRGGGGGELNEGGVDYVAYIFAHNDGDGEFGPDGDADIIKCGSYSGNGGTREIDLGFEPQWILTKRATNTGQYDHWKVHDVMRGLPTGSSPETLYPNLSGGAEFFGTNWFDVTSTGFKAHSDGTYENVSGSTYIYIAIRRGPLAVPEDATEVFAVDKPVSPGAETFPYFTSGFPVDMFLNRTNIGSTGSNYLLSRLTGDNVALKTNSTDAEVSFYTNDRKFDSNTGVWEVNLSASDDISWMWKRAPGYFDVVAYTGNGTAGRTVSHNLGVAPEMMWVKARGGSENWDVYHASLGASYALRLNGTFAAVGGSWNSTEPTSSEFTVNSSGGVNNSSLNYIAYLFASCPGVSKVGSYTGNGSSSGQNIDCGFTAGARFILIKRTDSTSNWLVFDTERGITVGNDPYLKLDVTDAETTNPIVDPYSSGFKLQGTIFNGSGESYIFYAVA